MTRRPAGTLPSGLQRVLSGGLILCAIISVLFVGRFSPLPMTMLLDAWIILFIGAVLLRGRILTLLPLSLVAIYAYTRVMGVWVTDVPWDDFVQAYRWLLYLVAMGVAVGQHWTRRGALTTLTWWLVSLATVKAALTWVVHGPGERPGLFLENNFELALFSGLTAVVHRGSPRSRLWLLLLLGVLTVLSGSRSGAVAYVLCFLYAMLSTRTRDVFLRMVALAVPMLVAVIPVVIFQERAAESEVIDRVRFFDVFLRETQDWGPVNWLVGTLPMTPMSPATCEELAYYEALFSSAEDGTCYSVILHAFALRVVFDAGALGVVLILALPWIFLRRAGVSALLAATLMAIAVTNSVSVSGFNNPYVVLPFLLAILTSSRASAGESEGEPTGTKPWAPPSTRTARRRGPASPRPARSARTEPRRTPAVVVSGDGER
ncbi:hypothetical protein [Nesterenkonia sp. PF2B19]|uniref:hypothetical protein n=1 Tax=Nesterenkonia sp. PF2B19 TaxID=1881858 RepID=UPI0008724197|nr:hypothetical protein [Nesterenkonia sp. PF2B19]OSM42854.1 hypothetical protein BCY76_012005 [Nesterenkonia sp. PF2B19]